MAFAQRGYPETQGCCGANLMKNTPAPESPIWNRVLVLAESMDEPECSIEHIRNLLCGLEEGFADTFDPAEDFPEYATHRLCGSLRRLLAQLEGQELQ